MSKTLRRSILLCIAIALCFGGYAYWRVHEDRLAEEEWAQYASEARARKVKLTVEEIFVPPFIKDEDNYAASPLWKRAIAGEEMQNIVPFLPLKKKTPTWGSARDQAILAEARKQMIAKKWIAKDDPAQSDAEAVIAGLHGFQPAFEELRSLRERSASWYPVEWARGIGVTFPHLTVMKSLGEALVLQALAERELGRREEAFERLTDLFRMAESLDSAPSLIPVLTSNALERQALAEFQSGMAQGEWNDVQLTTLQKRLSPKDPLARQKAALESERAMHNTFFNGLIPHLIGKMFVPRPLGGMPEWVGRKGGHWWRHNQIWLNRVFDTEIASFGLENASWRWDENGSQIAADSLAEEGKQYTVARMALPDFRSFRGRTLFSQTALQMGVIACALERFKVGEGKYPQQLQELVPRFLEQLPRDPHGKGSTYRYSPSESRYVLYSLGQDQDDDGGRGEIFGAETLENLPDWAWSATESNRQ